MSAPDKERRDARRWTIAFDFPESDDPLFAGWLHDGALGYASSLRTAAMFDTEEAAQRTLANSYGAETASYGAVVEVES